MLLRSGFCDFAGLRVCQHRTMDRSAAALPSTSEYTLARRGGDGARSTSQRVRRVLLAAAVSYLTTIGEPSNSTVGIRSVEWLRDHGAAGLVSKAESIYYSLNAPAKGGAALRALPHTGLSARAASARARAGT